MTILPRHKDVAKSRLNLRNPWHLLATGFGSGLSPVVPGTMGSLAAIPFWYLMTFLPWQLYSLVVMFGICIGGFVIFRILDMWKPWPIRWFDRNVHGGMGIMIDDIVAGVISAGILYFIGHHWPLGII